MPLLTRRASSLAVEAPGRSSSPLEEPRFCAACLAQSQGCPASHWWAWQESRGWCVGWPPQCQNDCPQLMPVFSLKPGKVGDRKGRVYLPSQVFLLSLVPFLLKQTCASKNVNKNKSSDSQGFV